MHDMSTCVLSGHYDDDHLHDDDDDDDDENHDHDDNDGERKDVFTFCKIFFPSEL